MIKILRFLVLGSMALTFSVSAQEPVHEFTLSNGLKLLVKEDHRAPVVVSQIWYKVGSSYEHRGITGISHVLEHMMFKGTKRFPAGQFSAIIAEQGGQENAFTSHDYTAYYQVLASDRLEVSFRMEADRMRNLTLPESAFLKELEVVKEERRLRTEDNPTALTYEQFNAMAFLNSPYSDPVIGWMGDLDSLTVADLRQWYTRWYAPNNATLVVVGDVQPDKVLSLAQRYFGPLKPSDIPPLKPRREPVQRGERRLVVKAPAELPYLVMGYKTPVIATAEQPWEPYALEVLAGILDGGDSARLSANLVRDQEIAARAGAGYQATDRLDGLFLLDATPAAGKTLAQVEAALQGQVDALREQQISEPELARVKAQVVAQEIYQQDSIQHQASQLGALESVGLGWQLEQAFVERIEAVSAAQVLAVAKKYLVKDQRTVAYLEPLPIDPNRPPSHFSGHLR